MVMGVVFPDSGHMVERVGALLNSRSGCLEGGETVNIVSLVMSVVDPIRRTWNRRDEVGASLVEYALLLALIAVVALVALHFLGGSVSNTLSSVGQSINNPNPS